MQNLPKIYTNLINFVSSSLSLCSRFPLWRCIINDNDVYNLCLNVELVRVSWNKSSRKLLVFGCTLPEVSNNNGIMFSDNSEGWTFPADAYFSILYLLPISDAKFWVGGDGCFLMMRRGEDINYSINIIRTRQQRRKKKKKKRNNIFLIYPRTV